jgi:hypothetical protein
MGSFAASRAVHLCRTREGGSHSDPGEGFALRTTAASRCMASLRDWSDRPSVRVRRGRPTAAASAPRPHRRGSRCMTLLRDLSDLPTGERPSWPPVRGCIRTPAAPARPPLHRVLARESHSAPRHDRQPRRPVRTPTIPVLPTRSTVHRVLARKSHSAPCRDRQPRRPVSPPTIPAVPARPPLHRVFAQNAHSAPCHNRQPCRRRGP